MYRHTYAKINVTNIKNNIEKIIRRNDNYDYYFGVVKAFCYGHDKLEAVKAIIDGGCNYLAVATLDEAVEVREEYKDIPILCLGYIDKEYIKVAKENNITLTVNTVECAKEIVESKEKVKVHIKVNTGMNRLGLSTKEEIDNAYNLLSDNGVEIEGIYSHIFDAASSDKTNKQFRKFGELVSKEILSNIKIVHIGASETITNYEKPSFVNGCRLGIIMYGFTNDLSLNLQSTFSLYSKVLQINTLSEGDTLGYSGAYVAKEGDKIAVICAGYADGIIRENTGRNVFINGREYKIVGNICMDMLFALVDDKVKVNDEVVLLKDNEHIDSVSKHLHSIPYEVLCTVSKRVPRIIEK